MEFYPNGTAPKPTPEYVIAKGTLPKTTAVCTKTCTCRFNAQRHYAKRLSHQNQHLNHNLQSRKTLVQTLGQALDEAYENWPMTSDCRCQSKDSRLYICTKPLFCKTAWCCRQNDHKRSEHTEKSSYWIYSIFGSILCYKTMTGHIILQIKPLTVIEVKVNGSAQHEPPLLVGVVVEQIPHMS